MNNKNIRKAYSLKMDNYNTYGRYYGYTPEQAASKAFSQAFRRKELIFVSEQIYTIYLLNKKEKRIYSFEVERCKLENSIIINIGNRKIGNRKIIFNFKNKVKLMKIDTYY